MSYKPIEAANIFVGELTDIISRLGTHNRYLIQVHKRKSVIDLAWLRIIETANLDNIENLKVQVGYVYEQARQVIDDLNEASELMDLDFRDIADAIKKFQENL